jgi:hypothetical protein
MEAAYFARIDMVVVGPLKGEFRDNGRRMELLAPLEYTDDDRTVVVLTGFVTDFNSIPRGLWNIFPPWQFPQAGVVHDFLYQTGGVSRSEADAVHQRILKELGCPWIKRRAAHLALRACGWAVWRRYRKAEAEKAAALKYGGYNQGEACEQKEESQEKPEV